MPPKEKPVGVVTAFFSSECDACRLHTHPNGFMTADLYRAGKGIIPISVTEIFFSSFEISEDAYDEMVLNENARFMQRRKEQAGG